MTAASGMRSDPSNVQARRSAPDVISKRPSLLQLTFHCKVRWVVDDRVSTWAR